MLVVIELDDSLMRAIAQQQAENNSYDRLGGCDNDLTEMYSTAFYDGMQYMKNLVDYTNNLKGT